MEKSYFKVWVKKLTIFKNGDANCEGQAEIERLKSQFDYSDGRLGSSSAYVFLFPDAETAYFWFFRFVDSIVLRYNLEAYQAGVSFEDNFNRWEHYKNKFIEDPANAVYPYYQLWAPAEV